MFEIWRGPATLNGVKAMMRTCESLLRDGKGDVSIFIVLEKTSPPPGASVRPLLAQWSREMVPRTAIAVIVAEGGGFRASIVRGVATALTLLAPHRVPFKFAAEVDEGVDLLVSGTSKRVLPRGELRAAVDEVRLQLG